ncbi:MAG: XisI protein [Chloroflexi bacterium]|nr:XisI protein [Chloroflexota bacterium]
MDKLKTYRDLVKNFMREFAAWANRTPPPNTELLCVFDAESDYYLLLNAQWGRYRCIQSALVFVRFVNDKIYIEEDWTEEGIANYLLDQGVPKQDIVLAFQPPEIRRLTEFALA